MMSDGGALIRSAYDAFSRGDIPVALAAMADDVAWHVPGCGPLSHDYRGHAEVVGFFQHFMRLSGGTFQLRVDDVLANGGHVVVLCTTGAWRGGRSWSSPQVHVWTMKDGKATSFREYAGNEHTLRNIVEARLPLKTGAVGTLATRVISRSRPAAQWCGALPITVM